MAGTHAHQQVEHITVNPDIAIVAIVGDRMRGLPGLAGRIFSALGRRSINIIAIAQGSSESNVSLVVEAGMMGEAVQWLHREFGLERRASRFESVEAENAVASL
jgi:aspartokinase